MPDRQQMLRNRLFGLGRRLARGSPGLRTKNAVRLALDILEANGIAEIAVRDRFGHEVHLLTGDKTVAAGVIRKGHFTFEVMEALAGVLRQHRLDPAALLFIDAGANIGTSCLNAAQIGFRRILAIEPDPDNFRLLARNLGRLDGAEVRAGAPLLELEPA